MAHLVFPTADYSRFSHSLGACAVASKIVAALGVSETERALYRVAALLHDIGHYPFSHSMEEAIRDVSSGVLLRRKGALQQPAGLGMSDTLDHEHVAAEIIRRDPEVSVILSGLDTDEVVGAITGESQTELSKLISASLDVDRADYLLRSATQTGLPYGSVDLDYLFSQYRLDERKRLCVTHKAMRTAEHFLLCRYFDYQQVVFHKTVVGFEWLLKDVLKALLRAGQVNCSAENVRGMVHTRAWRSFDDIAVWEMIRRANWPDPLVAAKARALIGRRRPAMVGEVEFFDVYSANSRQLHSASHRQFRDKIPTWAKRYEIPEPLWHVWAPAPRRITKIAARESPPDQEVDDEELSPQERDERVSQRREYGQEIRVCSRDELHSKPIVNERSSILSVLANYALFAARLYVLVPKERSADQNLVRRIRADVANDVQAEA